MGVLTDYFRARDDAEASRVTSHVGGPLQRGDDGRPPFDGIEARGVDHSVVLGQLVAIVRGVEWTPTLCHGRIVEAACGDLEEGPWVVALGDDVRDTLAAVAPAAIPELTARWARIEEMRAWSADDARIVLDQLCALARRARDARDHLYEWCAL